MKMVKVKNEKVGKRLVNRLVKKGYVVAEVKDKHINQQFINKADVVIVYPNEGKP